MMEEWAIREQLGEVRTALKRNEEEHEVLVSLLKGYEGWLRLRGLNGTQPPSQATSAPKGPAENGPSISFRQAVLKVVREARGEPLHVKEVLRRAAQLGAATAAKKPENHTDLTLYKWRSKGEPVVKERPRTWRWKGEA